MLHVVAGRGATLLSKLKAHQETTTFNSYDSLQHVCAFVAIHFSISDLQSRRHVIQRGSSVRVGLRTTHWPAVHPELDPHQMEILRGLNEPLCMHIMRAFVVRLSWLILLEFNTSVSLLVTTYHSMLFSVPRSLDIRLPRLYNNHVSGLWDQQQLECSSVLSVYVLSSILMEERRLYLFNSCTRNCLDPHSHLPPVP